MLKEHDVDVGYEMWNTYGIAGLLISGYFGLNRELTSWETRGCRAVASNIVISVKKVQGKYRYHFSTPEKQTVLGSNLFFLSASIVNYYHPDGRIESHPVDLYRATYGLRKPFDEEKSTQSYKDMIAHFSKYLRYKVETVRAHGMDALIEKKAKEIDTE